MQKHFKYICLFFMVLSMIPGVLHIGSSWLIHRESIQTKEWPSVEGEILSSKVVNTTESDDELQSFVPELNYQYIVNGNEFQGSRIKIDISQYCSAEAAEKLLASLTQSGTVHVFYDPDSPENSVLIVEEEEHPYFDYFIGAMQLIFYPLFAFSLVVFLVFNRKFWIIEFRFILAALFLGGMTITLFMTRDYYEGLASETWPSVEGKITNSHLNVIKDDEGSRYSPLIKYQYKVGALHYNSHRITTRDSNPKGKVQAQELVNKYPVGSTIMVFYNHEDPSRAVLYTGDAGDALGGVILGTTMMVFSICATVIMILVRRRFFSSKTEPEVEINLTAAEE
ncbi:MAG: DUF3592 domain-containing protein [Planctomycetaceae bacterium]